MWKRSFLQKVLPEYGFRCKGISLCFVYDTGRSVRKMPRRLRLSGEDNRLVRATSETEGHSPPYTRSYAGA